MKITVRRVYDFGQDAPTIGADLLTPQAWDAARAAGGPFGLASTRDEWEQAGSAVANVGRAREIVAIAHELGARNLCSYGIGGALIEQQIHRLAPDLQMVCADFAPNAVAHLQVLFPEVEIVVRDLSVEGPLPGDLHLMHRIDAELSGDQWQAVFERTRGAVIFVPSTILSLRGVAKELARRVRQPHATSAGWFRTEAALRSLWSPWFADRPITVGPLRGFLLSPRGEH